MKNYLLAASLALAVVVNIFVLGGVAWNRSGEADAVLQLTERELPSSWHSFDAVEDSGIELRLNYGPTWVEEPWFDAAKLKELGFDPNAAEDGYGKGYKHPLERRAYVVLEFDGPAWAARLKAKEDELAALPERIAKGEETKDSLKSAQWQVENMRVSESRLVPIDAGTDPHALRIRYSERTRYLITAAEVRMLLQRKSGENQAHAHGGIVRLLPETIQLPARFHRAYAKALARKNDMRHGDGTMGRIAAPRYRLSLRYGQGLEPWVDHLEVIVEDRGDLPRQ